MKTYTYTIFLRHPTTQDIQHGTISLESDGYLDWATLFKRLQGLYDIQSGYILLGMQIVEVADTI